MSGWRDDAACSDVEDPDLFFPRRPYAEPAKTARAQAICNGCPVWAQCLETVLRLPSSYDRDGIFAGLLPKDRRDLRGDVREHQGHALEWLTGGPQLVDGRRERSSRPHERRSATGHSQDTLTA